MYFEGKPSYETAETNIVVRPTFRRFNIEQSNSSSPAALQRGYVMSTNKPSATVLAKDIRESGIWFVLIILAILGIGVGILDVVHWDRDFGKSILAEANAVLIDIFLVGVLIAIYDYRRRRKEEITDLQKELAHLRTLDSPEVTIRKAELIESLTSKGQKPRTLRYYKLRGAALGGYDLSGVEMRFADLHKALMPSTQLSGSDLFCVDFSESLLVEANMTGANLEEANFSGASLSNAILTDANVRHADFRGALELTCEQLTSAKNWKQTYRDQQLACGASIPQPTQKSLGQRYREALRAHGDPLYPYQLVTVIHPDGKQETRVEKQGEK